MNKIFNNLKRFEIGTRKFKENPVLHRIPIQNNCQGVLLKKTV